MAINIFYSYSNHKDETLNTYNLICQHYENDVNNIIKIVDVDNHDTENNIFLIEKI